MIVSRIDGGLGNQLFQVAFGMQLAKKHGSPLMLDLGSYASQPAHGLMLDRFCLDAQTVDERTARRIPARYRGSDQNPWANWFQMNGLKQVRERPFGFNQRYLTQSTDDSYLVGYWQSERFFADVREEVLAQFRPNSALSAPSERLREAMAGGKSIALHVRRGDYVNNATNASIYRNLGLEYYRQAVLDYLHANEDVSLFIFSNDMAWCREHLDFECPTKYVDHTNSRTCHEDLWMMTAASCCVIANSTFSWWGAWLNQRPDKVVYAPDAWFRPGTLSDEYLNAAGWCTEPRSSWSRAA